MVAKKPKRGRPKKAVATVRSEHLHIRMLEEEGVAFRIEAAKYGMTVSAWLRFLGRKHAGMTTPGVPA